MMIALFISLPFIAFAQNNTTNWQKYETKNYSIEYPENYAMALLHPKEVDFLINLPKQEGNEYQENITLMTQSLKGFNINLEAYNETNIQQLKSVFPEVQIKENVQYQENGTDFYLINYKLEYNGVSMQCIQSYCIVKNVAYILTFTTTAELYPNSYENAIQSLKTFKVKKK